MTVAEEIVVADLTTSPGRFRTKKVTVTIPADILEAVREKVRAGSAPSLSAYVSKALADHLAAPDDFQALLDEMDQKHGAPTEEQYEQARRFLRQE